MLSPPRLRRNSLIIATGPTGGGGLRVYGVLRGGKIYTIYAAMPGKSWVLQYCLRENTAHTEARGTGQVMVHLDTGLLPPFPEEKFDFHRPAVPPEKAGAFIILHGVIGEDGSVGELRVLQGVQPQADRGALAAFGRWKFKPAVRAGKAVAVEILVGIPAGVPET